jgi:hypothetical protein
MALKTFYLLFGDGSSNIVEAQIEEEAIIKTGRGNPLIIREAYNSEISKEITVWIVKGKGRFRTTIHGVYFEEKEAEKCLKHYKNEFKDIKLKFEIRSFIVQSKFSGE